MALLHAEAAAADHLDGEPVLFRAALSPTWKHWRNVTCGCLCTWLPLTTVGIPFLGLAYCACGGACREAEYRSFELVLTPSALHFRQKMYACGLCCQQTVTKTIPLDKIQVRPPHARACAAPSPRRQHLVCLTRSLARSPVVPPQDVVLVSDCCGDCCGYSTPGKPYQMHVQTAGRGVEVAELTVVCLEDLEEFRTRVMAAKRAVTGAGGGAAGGAGGGRPSALVTDGASGGDWGKGGAVATASAGDVAGNAAAVAVLERIERALAEGIPVRIVGTMAATAPPATGGGFAPMPVAVAMGVAPPPAY